MPNNRANWATVQLKKCPAYVVCHDAISLKISDSRSPTDGKLGFDNGGRSNSVGRESTQANAGCWLAVGGWHPREMDRARTGCQKLSALQWAQNAIKKNFTPLSWLLRITLWVLMQRIDCPVSSELYFYFSHQLALRDSLKVASTSSMTFIKRS